MTQNGMGTEMMRRGKKRNDMNKLAIGKKKRKKGKKERKEKEKKQLKECKNRGDKAQ